MNSFKEGDKRGYENDVKAYVPVYIPQLLRIGVSTLDIY